MPLVVPTATTFRKYHQEHHSHLVSRLGPVLRPPMHHALPQVLIRPGGMPSAII